MRIAILTLPLHGNYGGILQNYALQHVLRGMGHTVETVQLPREWKLPLWKKPLSYTKRFLKKYLLRRECRIFAEKFYNTLQNKMVGNMQVFIQKHIQIRQVSAFFLLRCKDYDAIVVGSDQIWRPRYSYRPIEDAYLCFARNWQGVKRVAYAASFGTDEWEYTPKQTSNCKRLVKLFNAVSVREASGVALCKEHLGVEALHVLDPTLLLDAKDYQRLFEHDDRLHQPEGQLLTYVLDETQEKQAIIQTLAHRFHYQSFRANSKYEDFFAPLEERIQPPVEQWLKDFHEAKFVVTDSFHATVFSILFGKPFVVIGNRERGLSRIYSLLGLFGLENHIVYKVEDVDLASDYSFDKQQIFSFLQTWRKKSLDFLLNNLQ